MEQDNASSKKRLAEEPVDEERETKCVKLDPELAQLVVATKEECEKEMREWMDACDPGIFPSLYGWGLQNVAAKFIENCAQNYIAGCGEVNIKELAADHALAKSVGTGLHIIHAIAHEWARRPWICYGSYELQVLFHVLRHHIKKNNAEHHMERLLVRMMEIGENVAPHTLREVPGYAMTLVATMFYTNLHLLHPDEDQYFRLCTENIKGDHGFFEIIASNLVPDEKNTFSRSKSLIKAAQAAYQFMANHLNDYMNTPGGVKHHTPRAMRVTSELAYTITSV